MICNLCPRRCGAERMPDKAGGVCAMPTWPVAARAMLHQWEEPCLVGEHGAGAVFFSVQSPVQILPERRDLSGGLRQAHHPPAAPGDF